MNDQHNPVRHLNISSFAIILIALFTFAIIISANVLITYFHINREPNYVLIDAIQGNPDNWNDIRRGHKNLYLKNIKLSNMTLIRKNFDNVDFHGSEFINIKFVNCDFTGAYMGNSNYNNVQFDKSHMTETVISLSVLINVSFTETNLKYSNFTNSTLENVTFQKTNMFRATFSKTKFKNVTIDSSDMAGVSFGVPEITGELRIVNSNLFDNHWRLGPGWDLIKIENSIHCNGPATKSICDLTDTNSDGRDNENYTGPIPIEEAWH